MTGLSALPAYVLAPVLLILFVGVLPLFPVAGAQTPFAVYSSPLAAVGDVVLHLFLPATALTLSLIGSKFLVVRASAASALGADYMVLARAKGIPERLLKHRHVGRNALLPFLAILAAQFGFAVRGSVVIELIFSYPGIAGLLLPAAQNLDYPVLEASFLVFAVVVLTANLVVDVVSRLLDPRVSA
jgi:peptide/nickel transport system permease protein